MLKNNINNWNGNSIDVTKSRGRVIATISPFDNLMYKGCIPGTKIIASEIIQKLYKSNHEKAFNLISNEWKLKYYCDLQSTNSEDSLTWSIFSALVYGDNVYKQSFLMNLSEALSIEEKPDNIDICLWRRMPHPDTNVSGGPEIDVLISTDNSIYMIECKWRSGVGKKQGKNKDKSQIELSVDIKTLLS